MITYQFVKNGKGELINIAEINKDNRKDGYYCIECNSVMIPALGQKREHYFRHKCDVTCNRESYLHKLGKMAFKKRFDTSEIFPIRYYAEEKCTTDCKILNSENQKRYCPTCRTIQIINLKEFYDVCEEESGFNGYIADLKLSNSQLPNRKPIFIEIFVTHGCEPQKINSGIRIIEIKIEDEYDVNLPLDTFANPKVRFYNFKFNTTIPIKPKDFYSFTIFKENYDCSLEQISCHNLEDNNDNNLIKFILYNEPDTAAKRRNLFHYGLYLMFYNNPIRCCIFCYRYLHNICVLNIECQQFNQYLNAYQNIIHRIPIHRFQGNYVDLANNCNRFILANRHIHFNTPPNIAKIIM